MKLRTIGKTSEKFVLDNSPAILTGLGVVGTIGTAYFTGTATIKAVRLMDHAKENPENVPGPVLNWKSLDVLKLYIPPAALGILTCGAILGANHVNTRRAAGLAAAYSITDKAFNDYKEKVTQKLGEKKEQTLRDEIAKEKIDANPPQQSMVIIEGDRVLCYDLYSGRYFHSTMETLKKAQNDLNYRIIQDMYASLNDLYMMIDLDRIELGEEVGWTTDHLLEMQFSTQLTENQTPCLTLEFGIKPIRGYYKIHP